MKLATKLLGSVAAIGLLVSAFAGAAKAAEYPSKTVTWVVPFGAGGGTDRWSRVMSGAGFDVWGHGLRPRNIPGASGVKGWKWMLERKPDGHTIILASPTPVLGLARESKPIINAAKDVKICGLIGYFRPNVTIHLGQPYKDLDSLVAYAKKNPKKVVVGGSGSNVLGAAMLFSQLGAKMTYVVYPGTGKAIADFLGKHINIVMGPDEIVRNLAPKKALVIATSSNKPHPKGYEKAVGNKVTQPKDLGLKRAFEGLRWVGVHPKTPDDICLKISGLLKATLKFKPVAKLMKKIKAQPIFTPMAEAQKQYNEMVAGIGEAAALLESQK